MNEEQKFQKLENLPPVNECGQNAIHRKLQAVIGAVNELSQELHALAVEFEASKTKPLFGGKK